MEPPAVLAVEHIHPPDKQAGVFRATGCVLPPPGTLRARSDVHWPAAHVTRPFWHKTTGVSPPPPDLRCHHKRRLWKKISAVTLLISFVTERLSYFQCIWTVPFVRVNLKNGNWPWIRRSGDCRRYRENPGRYRRQKDSLWKFGHPDAFQVSRKPRPGVCRYSVRL